MNKDIDNLLLNNYGQMSYDEYEFIYDLIEKNSPCNLLIFGLGKDSKLWTKLNKGYTLFVEDNKDWIEKIKPELTNNFRIINYQYNTKLDKWIDYLNNENILNLLKIKNDKLNINWDIVIIDGPNGFSNSTPGRMVPISTTYTLNKNHVLIHDCDRTVENIYSRIFFGNDFKMINKLRIYEK